MTESFEEELKKVLYENGADLVGFADLRGIKGSDFPYGVSVAIAVSPEVILSIEEGPSRSYFDEYHHLNAKLNHLVRAGAEYLKDRGFKARAQTTDTVIEFAEHRTALPHKTVATRAGIGWIGKCAVLVTKKYGSAVRLSSLITDAPLTYGTPVDIGLCGQCSLCKDNCPAHAVSGELWSVNKERKDLYDPDLCRKKARELSFAHIQEEITLCGKCIQVCPFTRKYINSAIT